MDQAQDEEGICGRAWQAAWHPEDLGYTGEQFGAEAQVEVASLRALCHADGKRIIERGKKQAATGAALLVVASAAIVLIGRRGVSGRTARSTESLRGGGSGSGQ